MNILVTAGNTMAPIDKVRGLTNIFTGRTGAAIAREARTRGHRVTLLTSRPDDGDTAYRTFDDLRALMAEHVPKADAVVHCAAVSDYLVAGTYVRGEPVDASGKIKSDEPELWLRLVRAPKLVDLIRQPWGFSGVLVKFKLEVGLSDDELLAIAERSRLHSGADLMVANTLEGASQVAFLGPLGDGYERVARPDLARRLLEEIERRREMARVLLGVTGSVAAIKTPLLIDALRAAGHDVRVVATKAATYFFDPAPLRAILSLDEDEWPGERYRRDDPVLHIELRRWAELLLIAPLDANTLAKLAAGLADNCLTCVWRAWDTSRPVVLAPAMNTLMWEHPLTARHLAALDGVTVVAPVTKRLACGDVGVGAMAELPEIVDVVNRMGAA